MRIGKHRLVEFSFFPILAACATYSFAAPAPVASTRPTIRAGDDAAIYSLGLTFGGQLHHSGLNADVFSEALTKGIRDGLAGKMVTQEDKSRVAMLLRSAKGVVGSKNEAAAQEFLARNATAAGVTTLPSGLQYKVLVAGSGDSPSPKLMDEVTVQYRGRLLNGKEFESSYSRGQAASFRVNGVIKGWQEALLLMKPGAKWQLFVPPQLAYDINTPAAIPPGSLLVFDIELVKINAPAAPSGPGAAEPRTVPPKS